MNRNIINHQLKYDVNCNYTCTKCIGQGCNRASSLNHTLHEIGSPPKASLRNASICFMAQPDLHYSSQQYFNTKFLNYKHNSPWASITRNNRGKSHVSVCLFPRKKQDMSRIADDHDRGVYSVENQQPWYQINHSFTTSNITSNIISNEPTSVAFYLYQVHSNS